MSDNVLMRAVFEGLPLGVVLADARGRVMWENRRVAELLGAPFELAESSFVLSEELDGALPPSSTGRTPGPLRRILADGEQMEGRMMVCRDRNACARQRYLRVSSSRIDPPHSGEAIMLVTITDVCEQRKLEQELALAREQSRRAALLHEQILSLAAHDLQNPLTAIGIAAEQLGAGEPLVDHDQQRYTCAILRAVARVRDLLRDMRDLSQLDAGIFPIRVRPERADTLLQESMHTHQARAKALGVNLDLRAAPNLPEVVADRAGILRVLNVLVGNALRHCHGGETVALVAEAEGGHVCFEVRGEGEGISRTFVDISRGWQLGECCHSSELGMALAKALVEVHGGVIGAPKYSGTTAGFQFTIPIHAALS
jgi:signal transduction histidine kinase